MYKVSATPSHLLIEIARSDDSSLSLANAKDCAYRTAIALADKTQAVVAVLCLGTPFLTVYPSEATSIALSHVATCAIDYLSDHCNRPGNTLLSIGCPFSDSIEDMRQEAKGDLTIALCMGSDFSGPPMDEGERQQFAEAAIDSLYYTDLYPWSDDGDRSDRDPEGDVRIWFKLEY